jgi:hypothetical protein
VTAPSARIVHRTSGRTRLRTRGMKGRDEYFEQVQTALAQTRGVQRVSVSSLTESILIEHEGPIEEVVLEAERRGYWQIEDGKRDPYLVQVSRVLSESDEKLRQATRGRIDFETLTFLGFVAGGIYQIARGQGLPAGVTLLRYAVDLVGSAGLASLEKRIKQQEVEGSHQGTR